MSNTKTSKKPKSLIVQHLNNQIGSLKEYVKTAGIELKEFRGIDKSNSEDTNNNKQSQHVVLVGGGMSSEREVSYMSCNGIFRSLLELGYQVTFVDMGTDIAEVIGYLSPDYVFNGLHGAYGEDGCLQGLLNIMKIPYTGCGLLSSGIAFNKKISLDIFKSNGIDIANSVMVEKDNNVKADPIKRPFVIKPLSEGSSVGIELVFEEDDFDFTNYDFPYGSVLVEEYIKGREIQIAVLDGKALGTLEIKLLKGKKFYDYETKYTEGFADHLCPAPLDKQHEIIAMQIAEKAAKMLGIKDLVRVELIFDERKNKFYMLELNTHPGMTPMSICTEIAWKQHKISYTDLVNKMLMNAKFD